MANTLGRLLHLTRRQSRRDRSAADELAVDGSAMAETPGPPRILLPAAIFRQVLFDPFEVTPIWARPRAASAHDPASPPDPIVDETAVANSVSTDEPKPTKGTRRPKAKGSSSGTRTRSKRA